VERYQDKPFVLIGVNCHDSEEDYRKGVEEHEVTWLNAFAGEGPNPIAELWGVNSFPTMHIIDADGKIAALDVRGDVIEKIIDDLLSN
jgi:thioredoxin family protein